MKAFHPSRLHCWIVFTLSLCFCACHSKSLAPPVVRDQGCNEAYTSLLRKDDLDFRIVFGYKDARPARYVGDRYEAAAFTQKLLQYGFKASPLHEEEFLYDLHTQDGKKHVVHLWITSSSASPDDDENRKNPFQKWKSEHSESVFLTGLTNADLVFYYGHSRDGGGPDFKPPVLQKNLHVNYGLYVARRAGLKKMIVALSKRKSTGNIVGMYSCVSDRLFSKSLLKAEPGVRLLLSKVLLYYNDALDRMMDNLKSILEMRCQKEFKLSDTESIHFFDKKN